MLREYKSRREFMADFPDERSCEEHLEKLFWSNGPVSPYDPTAKVWKMKNGRYRCGKTRKYFNIKTNTIYHASNIKLHIWFEAHWIYTLNKRGFSARTLQRELGVTYKTAWFMAQRLRKAMGFSDKEAEMEKAGELQQAGIWELDEAVFGGKNKFRHDDKKIKARGPRDWPDKVMVMGLYRRGAGLIAKVIPNASSEVLHAMVEKYIKPGSVLITDGHVSYQGLSPKYEHFMVKPWVGISDEEKERRKTELRKMSASERAAEKRHRKARLVQERNERRLHNWNPEIHTNNVEGRWTIYKKAWSLYNWWSRRHIQRYLDEVTFRINTSRMTTSQSISLFLSNVQGKRIRYRDLINEPICA